MSLKTLGCSVLLVALATFAVLLQDTAEAQSNRQRMEAEANFTVKGTEGCLACHGGESMAIVGESPHGNTDNPHSPYSLQGCESCHGPGSVHVSRAGGGAGYPKLLSFKTEDNIPEQNAACLGCHAEALGELEGMAWTGSLHDAGGLNCGACHDSHTLENPMANISLQQENCAGCHAEQIDAHPRFESAGINFDQLSCYTCHDVHQLTSKE